MEVLPYLSILGMNGAKWNAPQSVKVVKKGQPTFRFAQKSTLQDLQACYFVLYLQITGCLNGYSIEI